MASHHSAPTITSVKDVNGNEIGHGDAVLRSVVTVHGTGARSELIRIFDNQVLAGKAFAGINGLWSCRLSGLDAGRHSVTAKSATGASPARPFVVKASP
ncbi:MULTISPECIES: hypothetical protein [unclassified Pseudomonas]|uniref:hypothetical protein n=1 Tax=unclassified Pseudomonas TaxID=196821 RepID=UPI000A1E723D|nr:MULTISPECIES: hypothetical protein [unclassified Pseudomonas]